MDDFTTPIPEPFEIIVVGEPLDSARPPREPARTRILPPQFGLRDLMVATAVIAVFLGAARLIHIWALLLTFAVFAISRLVDLTRHQPLGPTKQFVYDLLTGVLLPIGCLVYDPIFLHERSPRVVAFAVFGSQMLMLFFWLLLASRLRQGMYGFVAGFLGCGGLVAGIVGALLTPFTFVGLFVLIGALGTVPYFTAFTYFRHAITAWEHAGTGRNRRVAAITGFLAAFAVGVIAFSLREYVHPDWLKSNIQPPFFLGD
jgi:hypothetical protein